MNILAELTEIGHINFLFLLKFFVQAVDLKNSEIALTLGLYMIYSILALISINAISFLLVMIILFGSTLNLIIKKVDLIWKSKNDRRSREKHQAIEIPVNRVEEMSVKEISSQLSSQLKVNYS